MLKQFLSQPNGFGMYAQLTNEFGFGEQYALDYARDPAATQQTVNNIRTTMYQPGPSLDNNDDLGANSSTFIWEMLGMYPENSGQRQPRVQQPGLPERDDHPAQRQDDHDQRAGRVAVQLLRAAPEVQRAPVQQAVRAVLDARAGRDARLEARSRRRATGAPARRPPRRPTARAPSPPWGTCRIRRSRCCARRQHHGDPRRAERDRLGADRAGERERADRIERQPSSPRRSGWRRPDGGRSTSPSGRTPNAKQTFYSVPITLRSGTGQSLPSITLTRAGRATGQPAAGVQQPRRVR